MRHRRVPSQRRPDIKGVNVQVQVLPPLVRLRDGAEAARRAHNPEVVGSTPTPASVWRA